MSEMSDYAKIMHNLQCVKIAARNDATITLAVDNIRNGVENEHADLARTLVWLKDMENDLRQVMAQYDVLYDADLGMDELVAYAIELIKRSCTPVAAMVDVNAEIDAASLAYGGMRP